MIKFFSLLKAVMSQDMQIFNFKAKDTSSDMTKTLVPILLALFVLYGIGSMYLPIAVELDKANLMYILLELAIALPSILALVEGVYKSQGILFEAKDSELLFSLPISKKSILTARVIKLYVFQFLYSLLFTVPGIAIYAYYVKPTAYFYAITVIMLILFPIIPTVLGCMIGFITKQISVRFKARRAVQIILTFIFISILMIASFNLKSVIASITENAANIDATIRSVYFPIDIYMDLINGFDIVKFVLLIAINALLLLLFVTLAGKKYFRIISKSKENFKAVKTKQIAVEDFSYKKSSVIMALLKKEFVRYFSSTVYVVNTMFGIVLLLIATVALCLNFDQAIISMASENIPMEDVATLHMLAPKVYLAILIGLSFMTSITSSSISLEGKTFNISKSLPVKEDKMLLAKVLMSDIITIPAVLICDIIFLFSFEVSILDAVLIILASFIAPSIAAVFGLIVNLKYPKMNASSDTEVVKQSTSSMVAVFGGMFLAGVFVAITFVLAGLGDYAMIIEDVLLGGILLVLWMILSKYGRKRYREIEA
ncbi:MAG: hypothetical protein IKR04_03805 [Clostridia bacterium]|nr:hypothetical protein [Clostridia bacterium]